MCFICLICTFQEIKKMFITPDNINYLYYKVSLLLNIDIELKKLKSLILKYSKEIETNEIEVIYYLLTLDTNISLTQLTTKLHNRFKYKKESKI